MPKGREIEREGKKRVIFLGNSDILFGLGLSTQVSRYLGIYLSFVVRLIHDPFQAVFIKAGRSVDLTVGFFRTAISAVDVRLGRVGRLRPCREERCSA